MTKRKLLAVALLIAVMACNKDNNTEPACNSCGYLNRNGVFIVNEGNFGQGNGSLSFINLDSLTIENDVFGQINHRPLGDVPVSLEIIGEKGWIVVNNSAKIEVVDLSDFTVIATITGLTSPRNVIPVTDNKVYISDFISSMITVVDQQTHTITGDIEIPGTSEQMIKVDNLVFVAFWSNYYYPGNNNNKLFVIDLVSDQVIDTIQVGKEPNSMLLDKQGNLQILCSGGFDNSEPPSLWRVNPVTLQPEDTIIFTDPGAPPSFLCTNQTQDTLYFIRSGIYRMSITDTNIPDIALIPAGDHNFYSLAVDPVGSVIYATDVIDYQQQGMVLRFRPDGTFIDSYRAGIIPGKMVFHHSSK